MHKSAGKKNIYLESDAWKLQRGLWKNCFILLHLYFCRKTEAFWKRGAHWLCIYEYILLQPHRATNTGNHEEVALLCSSVPELIALVVFWCQGWDPIPSSSPHTQRHGLGETALTDMNQDMDMKTSPLTASRLLHWMGQDMDIKTSPLNGSRHGHCQSTLFA